MIPVCSIIRRFTTNLVHHTHTTPLLNWTESCHQNTGQDVIAGLLDTSFKLVELRTL